LAIIGDQFHECRTSTETPTQKNEGEGQNGSDSSPVHEWPEICGCTISVRQNEDIVSLWNRVDGDVKVREKIRYVLCSACKSRTGNAIKRV
jgi:translation initiation factor 4E